MTEQSEDKEKFDQTATRLKGIKNIMTPSRAVLRVTDTDLKWFNHFYTFEVQNRKCYQSIRTIAKEMGRAVSVAQERIDKLELLGLLTVGKEPFKGGERNTYTCTAIDVIVSRMTDAPATPQDKALKKSQLSSLLKKAVVVDSLAVNQGIRAMAKTIIGRDLSDAEVMQFAFQIAAEKLAVLGWNIETITKEKGKYEQATPQTAASVPSVGYSVAPSTDKPAGMAPESAPHYIGQQNSVSDVVDDSYVALPDDDHAVNQDEQLKIFDENGVVTEAFINSLTGGNAPHRNADGTVQSYRYVYWVARYIQDERDGVVVRTGEEYMNEARPWHVPQHLLPTPEPELEYDEDPNF